MLVSRNIAARLQRLEDRFVGDPVIILVGDPEGNNYEMTVPEFTRRWKAEGLGFVRVLRGYDPTFKDLDAILAVFTEAANMADKGLDDGKGM